LSETTSVDDSICFIAGLGLNINMPRDLLDQIDQPATSLLAEGAFSLEVSKVLSLIQKHFVTQLNQLGKQGFHPFLDRYRQLIVHNPGQKIFFHDNCIMWEGEFHSVNEDGSL